MNKIVLKKYGTKETNVNETNYYIKSAKRQGRRDR